MNMTLTLLIVLVLTVLFACILVFIMIQITMKRMLRAGARMAIEAAWRRVHEHENPTLKVVEAAKVLDEALRLLGYTGTLGEKLKKAGPRFTDVDGVWSAHKLRNSLVHDLSTTPDDAEVDDAIQAFHQALTDLGAKL